MHTMLLTDDEMNEIIEKGMKSIANSKAFLAVMAKDGLNKNRQPVEHYPEDLKAQVKVETIFLVTDPEHPGLILSFTNEEVCIHYCFTNQCTYTQIPLYKV